MAWESSEILGLTSRRRSVQIRLHQSPLFAPISSTPGDWMWRPLWSGAAAHGPPGGVSGESARVFVKTVQSSAAGCCEEEVGRRAGKG